MREFADLFNDNVPDVLCVRDDGLDNRVAVAARPRSRARSITTLLAGSRLQRDVSCRFLILQVPDATHKESLNSVFFHSSTLRARSLSISQVSNNIGRAISVGSPFHAQPMMIALHGASVQRLQSFLSPAPFPSLSCRIFWYKELVIGGFHLWANAASRDASRQPAACALTVEQKHYIVSACAPIQRCGPI